VRGGGPRPDPSADGQARSSTLAPLLFNLDGRVPSNAADVRGDDRGAAGGVAVPPEVPVRRALGVPAAGRRAAGQPVEGPGGGGDGRVRGRPALSGGRYVRNASPWHARIATGYVTTNARYVTLVQDSIAPEHVQLQTSRDNEICVLMVRLRGVRGGVQYLIDNVAI
jgi:hypothetical protein